MAAIVLGAIVIFTGGCAQEQKHLRATDRAFDKAWQLEDSHQTPQALDDLKVIAEREAKTSPELAAKALYEAGLLASERFGPGTEVQLRGLREAVEIWQKLDKEFPNSDADRTLTTPHPPDAPAGPLVAAYERMSHLTQGRDEAATAEALYQAGLFAKNRVGHNEQEKSDAANKAAEAWKVLYLEYTQTPAYRKINDPTPDAPSGLYKDLVHRIDRRNSTDWKYQLIDGLVKITGKTQAFSYGLALVFLAILVKIITFPLTKKQYAGMRDMQRMQPLVKELQKKYKGTELHEKTLALYKEHKVNMFGSCLPMLIQMPFLILMYSAVRMYEFAFADGHFLWIGSSLSVNSPKFMGHNFFGRNLADPDILILAIYAISMYVTTKLTPATDPQQQQQQNTMAIVMSGFFFFIFLNGRWSSAFVLYWLCTNVISIYQQYTYIYKPHKLKQQGGGDPPAGGSPVGTEFTPPVIQPSSPGSASARVRPRKKKRR